jgi:predicted MFS family arabinose efflux permease
VEGQSYGWTSATILGLFAVAAIGLIVFVLIELRITAPLAQLRLFRNATFAAGNFVALVVMFGLLGVIFLVLLFLQIVLGFSAIKAGLSMLPLPIMIMLVAPLAGRLTDRIGGRWILFAGTIISALGIYLMSNLSAATTEVSLILPMAVCGLGMGLIMAPVTTVVMEGTPVEQSGMGAGILSAIRQIGSVMGIAVLGAILQNQLVNNITGALAHVPEIAAAARDHIVSSLTSGSLGAGSSPNIGGNLSLPPGIEAQLTAIFKDQFAHSLDSAMKVGIIILLVGAAASLLISSNVRKSKKIAPPPL